MSCLGNAILSPLGGACVPRCEARYKMAVVEGIPTCVSKDAGGNVLASYQLTSFPLYDENASYNTSWHLWNSAVNATREQYLLADASMEKADKAAVAFADLQKAENIRGSAEGESAYEKAREAYYTLTKGDTWAAEEQERIAKTEAQPVVDNYLSKHTDLNNRITQQKSTIEVMNGVKDKVLSVEDDMQYSVSAFQKQIKAIRNQMNIDKKKQVLTAEKSSSWFDVLLNWLIAITTILMIYFIVRYMRRPKTAFSTPASTPLQR